MSTPFCLSLFHAMKRKKVLQRGSITATMMRFAMLTRSSRHWYVCITDRSKTSLCTHWWTHRERERKSNCYHLTLCIPALRIVTANIYLDKLNVFFHLTTMITSSCTSENCNQALNIFQLEQLVALPTYSLSWWRRSTEVHPSFDQHVVWSTLDSKL